MHTFYNYLTIALVFYLTVSPHPLFSFEGAEDPDFRTPTDKSIIVVSDTQSPLWVEELFLSSDNNEEARGHLFEHILKSRPDAVFHLGDLVSLGYSDDSWMVFDTWLKKLQDLHIPIYPTLGNHELLIFSTAGEDNFLKRFPFYSKTGYMKQIGPIAFILLNSNIGDLNDEEIVRQKAWYKEQLLQCESDSSVKAIIVGCHHPPFTNSKIVNPDEDVQDHFVNDFIQSKKSILFLSGHSHSFEHFHRAEKDFLTLGGGGGLHHPLYTEDESLYEDLYHIDGKERNFHYLQCQVTDKGFTAQVKMLKKDFSEIETVYQIEYNFVQTYIVETQ